MIISIEKALADGLIKTGMEIKTNLFYVGDGDNPEVPIRDINGNEAEEWEPAIIEVQKHEERIYLWQKKFSGSSGHITPRPKKYSWFVPFDAFRPDMLVDIVPDVATTMEEKTDKKSEQSIQVKWIRKDGKTTFSFVVNPKISEYFKPYSKEIKNSKNWEGLSFYYCPSLIENEAYKEKLASYRLFDDFGSTIYRSGKLNIAWLRCVEGKGEIAVDEPISIAELSQLVKNAIAFLKDYMSESFKDFEITGELKMNL